MLINPKKKLTVCDEKQLCKGDGVTPPKCSTVESAQANEGFRKILGDAGRGDLYVIGRLWIEALRTGLVGSNWSVIPTVQAAPPPPEVPQKPPFMKYKDLPIYNAPHYEYKDYKADQTRCAALKRKLIHETVQPYVTSFRKSITQTGKEVCCELRNFKNLVKYEICKRKQSFFHYMRCPNNLAIRQATVAVGGLTGFLLTRKRGVSSRLGGIGAGFLLTGAICFPEETDEYFRDFSYHTLKYCLSFYNFFCNKMAVLRERIPCPSDMPPPVADRPPTECTKKREAEKAEKAKKAAEAAKK